MLLKGSGYLKTFQKTEKPVRCIAREMYCCMYIVMCIYIYSVDITKDQSSKCPGKSKHLGAKTLDLLLKWEKIL